MSRGGNGRAQSSGVPCALRVCRRREGPSAPSGGAGSRRRRDHRRDGWILEEIRSETAGLVIVDDARVRRAAASQRYEVHCRWRRCRDRAGHAPGEHGRRVLLLERWSASFGAIAATLPSRGRRPSLHRSGYRAPAISRRHSNHWSGLCRPLDADDFARHPHMESSGWPIRDRGPRPPIWRPPAPHPGVEPVSASAPCGAGGRCSGRSLSGTARRFGSGTSTSVLCNPVRRSTSISRPI